MSNDPLGIIKDNDEDLFANIAATRKLAFGDSELSLKEKLLIALALDASKGAVEGVKIIALQAKAEGASKEEIMDALRVTYYICGVGSIYSAAKALDGIL